MAIASRPVLDLLFGNRLSCVQILRAIAHGLLVVFVVFLSGLPGIGADVGSSAPLTLAGAYTFVSDAGGGAAPGSMQILLTFGEGKVILTSAPANPRYRDEGSFEYKSGTLVKLVLPHAGKFVSAGRVLRQGNTLILPFKLLSGGAGTSTWKLPACRTESIQPLLESIIKKTEQQIPFEVQAFLRQSIELRVAPRPGLPPLRREKTPVLEPVQRRIERPLRHLHDVARHVLQALRDGVPVHGAEGDDFQDEQVECALGQIGFRGHRVTPRTSTYLPL